MISASRPSTEPENRRLDGWVSANRATARTTSQELSSPSAEPDGSRTARTVPSPSGISTASATTATTAAAIADRRTVARVTGGVYGVPVTTSARSHLDHEYLLNVL